MAGRPSRTPRGEEGPFTSTPLHRTTSCSPKCLSPSKPRLSFRLGSREHGRRPRATTCGNRHGRRGTTGATEGEKGAGRAAAPPPGTHMLLTSVPAAFSSTSSVTSRPAGNWGCCGEDTPTQLQPTLALAQNQA